MRNNSKLPYVELGRQCVIANHTCVIPPSVDLWVLLDSEAHPITHAGRPPAAETWWEAYPADVAEHTASETPLVEYRRNVDGLVGHTAAGTYLADMVGHTAAGHS